MDRVIAMGSRARPRADGRATSTVVNYVLLLAVLAILISTIVAGSSSYVDDRRSQVVHDELEVVANRLAADLTTADGLAGTVDPNGSVEMRAPLPERVARRHYRVEIRQATPDTYALRLAADGVNVTAWATLTLDRPVRTGSYSGGPLRIGYDPAAGRLEVRDD